MNIKPFEKNESLVSLVGFVAYYEVIRIVVLAQWH